MQDGKPIFTDYVMKNPDGLSPKNAIGTFTFAQSSGPFILSQDEVTQLMMSLSTAQSRTASFPSWKNPRSM